MKEPLWVLPEVVMAVHQILIADHGGLPGIRDKALLDSALNRPQQRIAYSEKVSVFDLAASYSHGLIRNHPFVDGNKRVALTVAGIFLEINGYPLNAPEPETALVFNQLAAGELPEEELAAWFRENANASLL